MSRTPIACLLLLAALAACNTTETPPPSTLPDSGVRADAGPPADAGTVLITLTHSATSPFAATTGDLSFVDDQLVLAATSTGIMPVALSGARAGKTPAGWSVWALSATVAGPAASAIAVLPGSPLSGISKAAAFLPSGQPQVGLLEVHGASASAQGRLLTESALAAPLSSMFPAGLGVAAQGPAAEALWVVDAIFGAGSAVRAYPYASWNGHTLSEDPARRFTPVAEDLDGDGMMDTAILGRVIFRPEGDIGLVAFTMLGGAKGYAGGVYAFDAMTGAKLGLLTVPLVDTSTTTNGYVSSLALDGDTLVVVTGEKGPMFAEVGGQAAIYHVDSWRPFKVADLDPMARFDQPSRQLRTTLPGTVGVGVVTGIAITVNSPFFMASDLDLISLHRDPPLVEQSIPIGAPYVQGNAQPYDPRVSPNGNLVLIGTEAGMVRLTVERR